VPCIMHRAGPANEAGAARAHRAATNLSCTAACAHATSIRAARLGACSTHAGISARIAACGCRTLAASSRGLLPPAFVPTGPALA